MVGEHGSTLSGGHRQRIAIAHALVSEPHILIFDEATSALDYESERVIQQKMSAICQGRTVIIIAHRLSAVRHANRILVLDHGQIVEAGTHVELLEHDAGYTPDSTGCKRDDSVGRVGFKPVLECGVEPRLPAVAGGAKPFHHLGREADRDAFFNRCLLGAAGSAR
jgi:ABC-type multidrug transport system ATPase subunit